MEGLLNKMKEEMRIVTCPACFERLPADVVCCVNGHVICRDCKRTMTQCPTCRKAFSAENHTFISRLLEALPYLYEGCSATLLNKYQAEEHEKLFCSHGMVRCREKVCSWTGKLKDLRNHVETSSETHVLADSNINTVLHLNILDSETEMDTVTTFLDGEYHNTFVCEYFDHFFWREQVFSPTRDELTLRFTCVPNERAKNSSFVVSTEFQGNGSKLTTEIELTANFEAGVLEGVMIFNTEMLKMLKKERLLKYNFQLKEI